LPRSAVLRVALDRAATGAGAPRSAPGRAERVRGFARLCPITPYFLVLIRGDDRVHMHDPVAL
jgi:hypothetical protein